MLLDKLGLLGTLQIADVTRHGPLSEPVIGTVPAERRDLINFYNSISLPTAFDVFQCFELWQIVIYYLN
jgi:hypothetical protein